MNEEKIDIIIELLKFLVICLFMIYTNNKIISIENETKTKKLIYFMSTIIVMLANVYLKINNYILAIIYMIIIYAIMNKFKLIYSSVINLLSFAINLVIFVLSSALIYFPARVLNVENKILNFIVINIIQGILVILFWKIKRVHNGITFLKKWKNDEYINLLLLNISIGILFITVILSNYQEGITSKFGVMLIIFAIVMFITIWKSLQLYYKQQMLEKVLEKTQKDRADKTEEVKKLEAENLSFSEISHSIAHRQDSLKHKLEKLSTNTEFADEISINA